MYSFSGLENNTSDSCNCERVCVDRSGTGVIVATVLQGLRTSYSPHFTSCGLHYCQYVHRLLLDPGKF